MANGQALPTPNPLDRILSSHIKAFTYFIQGAADYGQALYATQYTDAADYANKFGNVDAASGLAAKFQYGPAVSPTTIATIQKTGMTMTATGSRFARLGVGDAAAPDGNLFLVNETTSDSIGQTASIETNVTAGSGGDYSALRVVMREMTTANNQSHAAEIHGLWSSGDGSQFRSGLTITVQGTMAGDSGVQQNAIRLISIPTTWTMVGGQDMDNALVVQQGDVDFNTYLRFYNKTGVLKGLWEKTGQITAGTLIPLTGSTHDLGSAAGALYYRASYIENNITAANGTAAGPTITFLNTTTPTTTGFSALTAGDLKFGVVGVEGMRIDTVRNVVMGNVATENTFAAYATTATGGFPYIPTCAGTPTGVPSASYTGRVPMIFDTTNNKIFIYDGGWIGVTLS